MIEDFKPDIAKQVLQRDNYICKNCHVGSTDLNIINRIPNCDNNDIKLLVTICKNCESLFREKQLDWVNQFDGPNEKPIALQIPEVPILEGLQSITGIDYNKNIFVRAIYHKTKEIEIHNENEPQKVNYFAVR